MPKKIALISALILGIITVFLIKVWLNEQARLAEERAKEELLLQQKRQAEVVVAKVDIPKGTQLTTEHLETKLFPRDYIQPKAVGSIERLIGMVTAVDILKGEQITLTKLLSPQQSTGTSLAMATPVGKRAITIPVDNISSLAGMIRPGDCVDVIGLVPIPSIDKKQPSSVAVIPLFQNVLVLAVGQQLMPLQREERYEKAEEKAAQSLITLALSPQEANFLAFIQEQGKIRLILRSPADSRTEPIVPANWETLSQYLFPKLYPQQAQEQQKEEITTKREIPQERKVEIYRGLKKEEITLTQ
jgi:pilus assembly protein CpaB